MFHGNKLCTTCKYTIYPLSERTCISRYGSQCQAQIPATAGSFMCLALTNQLYDPTIIVRVLILTSSTVVNPIVNQPELDLHCLVYRGLTHWWESSLCFFFQMRFFMDKNKKPNPCDVLFWYHLWLCSLVMFNSMIVADISVFDCRYKWRSMINMFLINGGLYIYIHYSERTKWVS